MRKLKTLKLLISGLLMVIISQGCGSNFQSQSGQELTALDEERATIELSSASLEEGLVLKIPQEFLSSKNHEQEFQWFFIDEEGNRVDLQTYTDQFDLTGLDFNFFINGFFEVKMPENSAVRFIVFIIKTMDNPVEHPVVGLPPMPIGQRVVGLPPMPIGQRVVGLPPMPLGERVVGLPAPVGISVIGLRAVGLPAQPSQ